MSEDITKRIIVADFLHHHIQISAREKRIISTEVFNRLHNVLQNSTLFLTYPSNRTSRFSHSLGVMHIAGQIFVHGVLNATDKHRKEFLEHILAELDRIQRDRKLHSVTKPRGIKYTPNGSSVARLQRESLYKTVPLPYISTTTSENDALCYAFLVAFQAVRLGALLHDVGHPPFSHVTESALERVRIELRAKPEPNVNEERFLDITTKLSKRRPTGHMHELLGYDLSVGILRDITNLDTELESRFDTFLMSNMTLLILKSEEDSVPCAALHAIFDSDLDADRLDYVSRESKASGLDIGLPEYERLLGSFQLVQDGSQFVFVPSARALRSVEEFLRQRHLWYKYVIKHHRVVKTDGLLRSVVVKLAKDYLGGDTDSETEQDEVSNYLLPTNISGLWKVYENLFDVPPEPAKPRRVKEKEDEFRKELAVYLRESYTQWDDAWLLSVLRLKYYTDESIDRNLEAQIGEILSNRKHYQSLYKRLDTFGEVDNAFWESLQHEPIDSREALFEMLFEKIKSTKVNPSEKEIQRIMERIGPIRGLLLESPSQYDMLLKTTGVALSILIRSLQTTSPLDFINSAVHDMIRTTHITDTFAEIHVLTAGLKREFKLINDTSLINLSDVSSIEAELARSCDLFPPLYVYVYRENETTHESEEINAVELSTMRIQLGRLLWDSFVQWVKPKQEKESA